ncbi:MAG: TPM domain-containing protein [Candidatus Rokubacteria bacterium]|nr:TPM domain-containing protein [Candidatus Rokubacteria bacterium]
MKRLLGDTGPEAVTAAIHHAEAGTSGEIRVHLERRFPRGAAPDPLARAREVFLALGMQRTVRRSGVLIYLAVDDRKLAILGDQGVHARVGDAYWERLRDLMVARLRAGRALDAVLEAVGEVGRVLGEHFPRRPDDTDELPDRLSTS